MPLPEDEVLSQINREFLEEHRGQALSSLNDLDGIMIYVGGELSLWRPESSGMVKKSSALLIKEESTYTRMKVVSHISVYLVQLMEACIEKGACESKELMRLKALKQDILHLKGSLEKLFLVSDWSPQEQILNESLWLLEKAELEPVMDWDCYLTQYLDFIAKPLEHNKRRSTELQVTELHHRV